MYPLLLEFNEIFEKQKSDFLIFVAENIENTTIKNGEFMGKNIKEALQAFGKNGFGENGIGTILFRNGEKKGHLINRIKQRTCSPQNDENTVIYPFGVVNEIINEEIIACSLSLNGKAGILEEKSFLLVLVTDNDCLVTDFDSTMKANAGNCIFIPANTRVEIIGEAELILIHC